MDHTCPWWLTYTFDNCFRRMVHNPAVLFAPWLKPGQTVLDVGCGIGFTSLAMARLVGPDGLVLAVDLQQKSLDVVERRARAAGCARQVRTHRCQPDRIGIERPVDFALAFWMLHEVRDQPRFLAEVASCLKPGGRLMIAEPRGHVSGKVFQASLALTTEAGLKPVAEPTVRLSRAAVLERPE